MALTKSCELPWAAFSLTALASDKHFPVAFYDKEP